MVLKIKENLLKKIVDLGFVKTCDELVVEVQIVMRIKMSSKHLGKWHNPPQLFLLKVPTIMKIGMSLKHLSRLLSTSPLQ